MAANQNVTQLTQQVGTAAPTSLFYAVTNGTTDTGLPLSVFVNSLGLTGTPTAPTATTGTNTTQIASTAFVQAQLASTLTSYATLASPTFTGTVVIPTVTLSGGTINGTVIGGTTPAAGSFTTLSSSGLATLSSMSTSAATISGGSVNSTSIGATTASTGKFTTLQATGLITPTSTIGIAGTGTNDNAQAGSVGEFVTSSVTSVSISTTTPTNVTSISLTAGDWDVWGNVLFVPAGSTTQSQNLVGINTVSATLPASPFYSVLTVPLAAGAPASLTAPQQRVSIASTTTVFLVAEAIFATSTETVSGYIAARRRR